MQRAEVEQIMVHPTHHQIFHKVVEEMQVMVLIQEVLICRVKMEQLILVVVAVVVVIQVVEAQQQMVVLEVAE